MTSSTTGERYETRFYQYFLRVPFRLFTPSNSDDLSHDETLSSRIAALNLLDLSLENLGVEIDPSVANEMVDVIKACGGSKLFQHSFASDNSPHIALTQLDSPTSRRPAEKSAHLVKAHKIIVGEYLRQHSSPGVHA